jgi:hypothetical protein
MSKLNASRASGPAALVVAVLALLVALTGTSVAAAALAKNSVGTKQLQNNSVTTAKVKDGTLTKGDFAAGELPAGPTGATGAAGPKGADGAMGMVRGWAEISSTGTVVRTGGQFPLTTAQIGHGSTGVYTINAPGWGTATAPQTIFAALSQFGSSAGQITSSPALKVGMFSLLPVVDTFDKDGTLTDAGFTVLLP